MAKNLSLSHIKKQDIQKYKEKKQVLFDDGKTKVDVDVVFRPSKINEVIADLIKLIQAKVEKEEAPNGETIMAVVLSLIVKHFSSIDVKGANTFDDYLEMHIIMNDNGYLSPILQAFDPQELQKAIDEVNKNLERWTVELNKIIDEIKAKQEQKEVENDATVQESE
jgi:hypothetical protein